MEKCFNIAGPCFPAEHYMLSALERLPGIERIVEQRSYFVLHAARQSGKTTAIKALVSEINGADREVYGYNEATPHLVMIGYLQRVVNGGGRIAREMALGSKRLDLCVEFGKFRYAVELKMRRNFSPTESPAQLAGYLDHLGLSEGWMAVFDDDASKSWDEKIYTRDEVVDGKTIHVIGL